MGKFLVAANKHAKLVVVYADVLFHHIVRYSTSAIDIVVDEIEHHVGIIHCCLAIGNLGKTIVVVPRFHYFYQFVNGIFVEVAEVGVISEHVANFLFRKTNHLVELVAQGIVRADVEAARQVVHRNGTYASDEDAFYRRVRSSLYRIKEVT